MVFDDGGVGEAHGEGVHSLVENSTFFSQQKVGLQHAINHRFLGRCQMPHTYITNHEIVTSC